jgi:hypothetical protein
MAETTRIGMLANATWCYVPLGIHPSLTRRQDKYFHDCGTHLRLVTTCLLSTGASELRNASTFCGECTSIVATEVRNETTSSSAITRLFTLAFLW